MVGTAAKLRLLGTLTTIAIGAAAKLSAQTPGSQDARPPEPRRVYEDACAACHGSDGRGRSAAQLGFDVSVPDFTDCDFATREPNGDWFAITHQGGPIRGFDRMMPSFGEAMTVVEIDAALEGVREFCENDDWPRGELNVPRALFTEKAYPEDEAVITTTLVTEGNDSITHALLWEQRFGARNQMEVSLPVSRTDLGAPDGWTTGAGDLGIGVKHVVSHSLDRGSIFSIGGEIVLATGGKEFGNDTTIFEPYLAYGKLLPNESFFQVQFFAELPSDSARNDEVAARAAYGRSFAVDGGFGRAWTPMIEILGAHESGSDEDTNWDVVPQFQVTLNTRQHVMANMGFRIPANNRDAREVQFVFYLLWDWFDGGILEGW